MIPLRHNIDFLRGLLSGRKAYTAPLSVNIDATHRCNLRCAYCRWHSPLLEKPHLDGGGQLDLSPELFSRLCADLRGRGTQTLLFVGAGEPLLHPRIHELIGAAKRCGFRVVLYSNGLRLDETTLQTLIDARLDVLRVTLGDTSAERFDRKHPQVKPGAFQRILDGLSRLSRMKREQGVTAPQLELGVPIDRHVLAELDTIIAIAASGGCDGVFFSVVLDFGEEALKHFGLSPEEVGTVCSLLPRKRGLLKSLSLGHNIDEVLLRYRIGKNVSQQVPCYSAWNFSFVRSDGKVLVCQRSELAMGDLAQNSFGEIWNNEEYQKVRRGTLRGSDPPSFCEFCPHLVNNHRLHRTLGWLLPQRRVAAAHRRGQAPPVTGV